MNPFVHDHTQPRLILHLAATFALAMGGAMPVFGRQAVGPEARPVEAAGRQALPSGVVIEDIKIGDGAEIKLGTWPTLHFRTMTVDGTIFADSRAQDPPMPLQYFMSETQLGGWVEGLPGMRVGGIRRVTMPPAMSYRGEPPANRPIGPTDSVVFEFECLDVQSMPHIRLATGLSMDIMREGTGEPAGYGDWVTVHMRIFAGEGETFREGFNTRENAVGEIQVALPTPDGVFTGSSTSLFFNMPYLDMMLYGMKAGERRDCKFASSKVLGPVGDPRIGIRGNEPFVVELECMTIDRGPALTLRNGIRYEDVETGTGRFAHMMEFAHIYFRGELEDGTVIETNESDESPAKIRLYHRNFVAGLRYGIQGMREGGTRRLYVPARMAFGHNPPDKYAHVPPDSDVIYQVRLVSTSFPPQR
jgi:FKBP-type peptidyl-prolyl cis-trans isomerase